MSGLEVGQTVQLNDGGRLAIVRYVGQTEFAAGEWIGVELEDYSGKNDGSVKGQRYFDCDMGRGMFLRPSAVKIIEQPPPKPKPAPGKRLSRPSGAVPSGTAKRMSSVQDSTASKRMSINAPSPSPANRTRPSSLIRSPAKSPTKQLSAASSTAPTPRTGTPSNARTISTSMTKAQPSVRPNRTSMGPPTGPVSRTNRQSITGGIGLANKASVPSTRTAGGRTSIPPKPRLRPGLDRIGSIGSQLSGGQTSEDGGQDTGGDGGTDSPVRSEGFSLKALSPVMTRVSTADRLSASPVSSRSTSSPATQRNAGQSTAATREIDNLKAKLRVMEGKRMEDREKLKAMDKHQSDKEKYDAVIKKFQSKAQEQQQEIAELRKELKEASAKSEEIETIQAGHEVSLEMATLDREMAEETADVLKTELEAVRLKAEEFELEVEILREEVAELGGEMSPEEKSSHGWIQMQLQEERLKLGLLAVKDQMDFHKADFEERAKLLESEVKELRSVKESYDTIKEKFTQQETIVEDLRQQLDTALGAEDMIEELTEKNMAMGEHIDELKATIEDLESLKEVNDELEINHIETEKEMQEDIDFKDSVISEQARRATQQDNVLDEVEYMVSRYREIIASLQSDLQDMRASHEVTEAEAEQLNNRARAMEDLNRKLHISAAKTQLKTIDLELRRLDAQEASDHLAIVQLFLPEGYHSDRDSVLALLRFKRVGFKANLLHGFVKERVNGKPPVGHEENVFSACDALDKLAWVTAMCDRFVNALNHCSSEEFAKFEGALYELEPVERALNGWIDGLRRDELKESQCASELQRTIALMSHLAEVHVPSGLASYADEVHMRTLIMQSHLDSAASAITCARSMVQTAIPALGDEDEHALHFARKTESVITSTRSAKVVIGKAVRALGDLKNRSLSLAPDTIQMFEQCETATEELACFSRQVGFDLCTLLHEEGRLEPFTLDDVQSVIHRTTAAMFSSSESDLFSTYSNKLRALTTSLVDLAALASDLEMTQEFERAPAPWVSRSQQLKSSKTVTVDAEEEIRRLKDDNHERARMIAMRDQTLDEATVKIELLESRMRDAAKKNERITELEKKIETSKKREVELSESLESQNKELTTLDVDREKWRKVAEDAKALGIVAPGSKAGQERAVATAREMDTLKTEIESLQAAVRYLREDNRRARLVDSQGLEWLAAPLIKPRSREEQRQDLVISEGQEVLNELLNLTTTAHVYDLSTMPKNRLAWRRAKTTPQYHVAKQKEDFAAWNSWKDSVLKKAHVLTQRDANRGAEKRTREKSAARICFRLPDLEAKGAARGREVEIVDPGDFESFRESLGFV
ncbi:dynein associated protein-domain-containing protein [Amylocarpus encephaloides]|uniref:Dynein associated protein-domain-containing protein n=1 Tax=Amylocarpus encephaloides TaxID=45428 RepID=A0A9P8C5S9_9HELO|nr:dynein associated protein-domain-containing protein [Amylocarpus encephaloides]